MNIHICLLQTGISELFVQASSSGIITLADRYGLLAAMLNESLTEEEKSTIDRILYSLRKGRLRIVNELSVVL